MKKIKRLARPKTGRKTYSHSVSLTLEQIEWLRQFPNASEVLRKLIDSIRELHGEIEPKLSLLAMKHEIDILEEQMNKVSEERGEFIGRNFEQTWDDKQKKWVFTPRSTYEEPKFLQAQLKAYNETLVVLESRLKELKDRFVREVNLINK